jgi:hypothetical protein
MPIAIRLAESALAPQESGPDGSARRAGGHACAAPRPAATGSRYRLPRCQVVAAQPIEPVVPGSLLGGETPSRVYLDRTALGGKSHELVVAFRCVGLGEVVRHGVRVQVDQVTGGRRPSNFSEGLIIEQAGVFQDDPLGPGEGMLAGAAVAASDGLGFAHPGAEVEAITAFDSGIRVVRMLASEVFDGAMLAIPAFKHRTAHNLSHYSLQGLGSNNCELTPETIKYSTRSMIPIRKWLFSLFTDLGLSKLSRGLTHELS